VAGSHWSWERILWLSALSCFCSKTKIKLHSKSGRSELFSQPNN
jgi:hypothetical protein